MADNPDPSEEVLCCRMCGDTVTEHGETTQRGVWVRRSHDNRPGDRELLCLDCAIDERRNPDAESRADVRGSFLDGLFDTPDPRLDPIVERYDDYEVIDGTDAAASLGISLATFEELVEVDPRFECGVSSHSPWVNMASYWKFYDHDHGRGENTTGVR